METRLIELAPRDSMLQKLKEIRLLKIQEQQKIKESERQRKIRKRKAKEIKKLEAYEEKLNAIECGCAQSFGILCHLNFGVSKLSLKSFTDEELSELTNIVRQKAKKLIGFSILGATAFSALYFILFIFLLFLSGGDIKNIITLIVSTCIGIILLPLQRGFKNSRLYNSWRYIWYARIIKKKLGEERASHKNLVEKILHSREVSYYLD